MNDDVRGLKVFQSSEKQFDIAGGVVVADAAVEHGDFFAVRLELLLEPGGCRLRFRNAPTKRNRTPQKKDTPLIREPRPYRTTPHAPFVRSNLNRLKNSGRRLHMLVP